MSYVEVPHDVLVAVHHVAHQGGVLDPKCGTNIKMPPLTGIFWCWSQVSRTQTDNFFPVRRLWRKVSVRRLLTTPGEEKNLFDSITSIFGHILTYLKEESASEHQEGPLRPPSTWAVLTILPCKITKIKMLTDWDVSPTPGGWKFFWDIPYTYLRYPESFVRKNHQELIFTFWSIFDSSFLTSISF